MHKLHIKPLSVNRAWQGRRFKTKEHKEYCQDVIAYLPPLNLPSGKLCVSVVFGQSSKLADIDNPIKIFLDCLQKRYGFNDKHVYRLVVDKVDVEKGSEYICFRIDSV